MALPDAEPYGPRLTDVDRAAGDDAARWVLPATILGSSLAFIDGSVVNVALPAIQGSLEASLGTVQWFVNGYMLMLASSAKARCCGERQQRRRRS